MDAQFNGVFRLLSDDYIYSEQRGRYYELFRRRFFNDPDYRSANIALLVRDTIERVIGALNMQEELRADARHFLLINFTEMVTYPLMAVPDSEFGLMEIIRDIEDDTKSILNQARERVEVVGNKQIKYQVEMF